LRFAPGAIDWEIVLRQLRATGLTYADISAATQVSKTRLIAMAAGDNEPLHANGECVINFWLATTKLTRAQIPILQCGSYLVRTRTAFPI
jgi:hypothetical protein